MLTDNSYINVITLFIIHILNIRTFNRLGYLISE